MVKRDTISCSYILEREANDDYEDYVKNATLRQLGEEYARKYHREITRYWYSTIKGNRDFLTERDDKYMKSRGFSFDYTEKILRIESEFNY
jgi:hypothetical protein